MSGSLSSALVSLRRMQMEESLEFLENQLTLVEAQIADKVGLHEGLTYVLEMSTYLNDATYLLDAEMFSVMWLAAQHGPDYRPEGDDIPNADIIKALAYVGRQLIKLKFKKSKLMHDISILEGLI